MSHRCDDNGNTFEERVDAKREVIVYICTCCSVCGAVVNRDESHREMK